MSTDGWFGVELRHVAALAAVAHAGSFREAAKRLGYVQSAISQQIAYLEQVVGERLVERSRGVREVRPTEAGEVLIGHFDEILSHFHAAQADLGRFSQGQAGRLRLGLHHSVSRALLPVMLGYLGDFKPAVQVQVAETLSDRDLFERVAAGELDAALVELPLESGPFESLDVMWDPCVLLVPHGVVADDRGVPTTAAELAGLRLIRYRRWRFLDALVGQLAGSGCALRFAFEADTVGTAVAMVRARLGCAILPAAALDRDEQSDTTVLDLAPLVPRRRIALFWHRERTRSPTVTTLCGVAKGLSNGKSTEAARVPA